MLPPPHPPPSVLSEAVLFTNCSSVRFPLDFVLIQSQRWSSFPSSLELTSLRNRWGMRPLSPGKVFQVQYA